jgi:hypothetical protein
MTYWRNVAVSVSAWGGRAWAALHMRKGLNTAANFDSAIAIFSLWRLPSSQRRWGHVPADRPLYLGYAVCRRSVLAFRSLRRPVVCRGPSTTRAGGRLFLRRRGAGASGKWAPRAAHPGCPSCHLAERKCHWRSSFPFAAVEGPTRAGIIALQFTYRILATLHLEFCVLSLRPCFSIADCQSSKIVLAPAKLFFLGERSFSYTPQKVWKHCGFGTSTEIKEEGEQTSLGL